jgi:hypothetical protein
MWILSAIVIALMLQAPPTVVLRWTAPVTNADSTPLTDLAGYEIAVSLATVDLNAGGSALKVIHLVGLTTRYDITAELSLLNPVVGTTYKFWANAYDTSDNKSAWSLPVEWTMTDRVAPKPPTDLSVIPGN